MICFKCRLTVCDIEILITHFKYYHGLKQFDDFTCVEEHCGQIFQSLGNFKRHVKNKHTIDKANISVISTTSISTVIQNTESNINKIDPLASVLHNQLGDESVHIDFNEIEKSIYEKSLIFSINLIEKNNLTTKDVLSIQDCIRTFIIEPILCQLEILLNKISIVDPQIKKFVEICKSPFHRLLHRLLQFLNKNELLKPLREFTINNVISSGFECGTLALGKAKSTGVLLPLRFQFRKTFEKDDNLLKSIKFTSSQSLPSPCITHFVQGQIWQKKKKLFDENDILVPYFLYIDDLEINNPLGSHSGMQSITVLKYVFPTLEFNQNIANIHTAGLIKAANLKKFGSNRCFYLLVEELKDLEDNPLEISTSNGCFAVRFILGLVLGDNLALNSVLGFTTSFSSNYSCRFCKIHKMDLHVCSDEDLLQLRTELNYQNDVDINNVALTGIKENSIFNQLKAFKVYENYSLDIMHDVFEGVCHYNICQILLNFIDTKKILTLDVLNYRKQNFSYGSLEIGNLSQPIKLEHIKKKRLNMSAREMMCFVYFVPLMIADLVPENDTMWNFLILFLEIIDCLLQSRFTNEELLLLKENIAKHNFLYTSLFQDTLKPKHHNLLHYPYIIKNSGPPRQFWCFRFEASLKQIKMYGHATSSRRNVSITIGKKMQMKFCKYILTPIKPIIDFNAINELFNQNTLISNSLNTCETKIRQFHTMEYKGTLYKTGLFLTMRANNVSIFKINTLCFDVTINKLYILCDKINLSSYNMHYAAYTIPDIENCLAKNVIFPIEYFDSPPFEITKLSNGSNMIRLKRYF